MNPTVSATQLGVVAIGRNEGERLERCLRSLDPARQPVVYVDSASTDNSVALARSLGCVVVSLDPQQPFTAARARNAGWRRLMERHPGITHIQFVDGDCEVDRAWLDNALKFLAGEPGCAGVCGRRRERHPERSLYNGLCDLEWDTPVGDTLATGGDAMFRSHALCAVGGYRDDLIAGEEPEMCLRLRAAGWTLHRLDHEMTVHDAAMTRFGQWWKRATRAGHAFAEGNHLHGGSPHHHYDTEMRRGLLWGLALPLLIALAGCVDPVLWLSFLIYPIQVARLWLRMRSQARVPRHLAFWQALFFVLGRFAEVQGWMRFHRARIQHRRSAIIEYK